MVLMFNVAISNSQFVDGRAGPAAVHAIQQKYGVSVVVRVQQKQFGSIYSSGSVKQLVTVRGSVCNVEAITQAMSALFELFTGHKVVSVFTNTALQFFLFVWLTFSQFFNLHISSGFVVVSLACSLQGLWCHFVMTTSISIQSKSCRWSVVVDPRVALLAGRTFPLATRWSTRLMRHRSILWSQARDIA